MYGLKIPFTIGEHCKLKKIPNFLKNKVSFDDVFTVIGFTIYGTSKNCECKVCVLYSLSNVKDSQHIYCSADVLKEC